MSLSPAIPPERPTRWQAIAAALVLFALQAVIRFQSSLNHDAAWYVYVAQGLLSGKRLYVDIIEVNPPLGMWLVVPPVWLAGHLGVAPVAVFYAYVFALILVSLALGWRYLASETAPRRSLLLISCAIVLLWLPANDFGQREHFMMLMTLPWLLLRMAPAGAFGAGERGMVGAVAGLGIALKPHAIFAPLLVEACLVLRSRNWRGMLAAENLAAIAAVAAYGGLAALFNPEFFTAIIALGRTAYVPYYGLTAGGIAFNAMWALVFAGLALWGLRDARAQVFAAAALGFLTSYALQAKGFSYQALPATGCAMMACVAGLAPPVLSPAKLKLPALVALCAALLMAIAVPQFYRTNDDASRRIEAVRKPDERSIFIASNHLAQGFPYVVDHGLTWSSRLPTQWLAPYLADHWTKPDAAEDPVIRKALDWTAEDLSGLKPDLIAIDDTPGQRDILGGLSLVSVWQSDARIAAILQGYDLVTDAGGFLIYRRR